MSVNSRWNDIFKGLENAGLDVYPPATKQGKCKAPYVVVKASGISDLLTISSVSALYDVMVYVPRTEYSTLEPYKADVKAVMDTLFPLIRPTHFETTPYLDETVDAWMVSIQYQNYQKKVRA